MFRRKSKLNYKGIEERYFGNRHLVPCKRSLLITGFVARRQLIPVVVSVSFRVFSLVFDSSSPFPREKSRRNIGLSRINCC